VAERQSLLSIQILRAFAALAVTCDHIAGYEFTRQYGLPDALPHVKFGQAGVDLFFVISGLVMVYASDWHFGRARAPQEFALRRLIRIVPLYWAMTTIVLLYLLLQYRDLARAGFSPAAVAASYLFIPWPQLDGFIAPVHGVGWTLNYEMLFYALFSIAVLFTRRTGVLLLAGLLLVFVIVNRLVSLPLPLGYWADPIVLEFAFGMLIALALRSCFRIPRAWAGAILLAAGVALVASDRWPDVHRIFTWGLPSACIVGALALADCTAKPGPAGPALSFLGDASYSLYLVHPLAITLPRRVFPHVVDPASSPWLFAGLLLMVAVSAAIAVHLMFERPITRYLQRRIASRFHPDKLEAAPATAG
jgi:exopolysaccharide production protein ExoZ